MTSDVGIRIFTYRRRHTISERRLRELSGHSTFLVGLRVDEDGDLRFAIGDSVVEIPLAADEQPLSLREVRLPEVEEAEFAPWEASGQPEWLANAEDL
jgi:hypothetical protein